MPGLAAGQIYAYRAHGPFAPEQGLLFDSAKVLDGLNWFDWDLLTRHADIHRFTKSLIALRRFRDVAVESDGKPTLHQFLKRAQVEWHGVALGGPDWSPDSHALAFTFRSAGGRLRYHVLLNAFWEPLPFELPPVPSGGRHEWRRCIDTALPSPDDCSPWSTAPALTGATYLVQPRSVVLLAQAVDDPSLPKS